MADDTRDGEPEVVDTALSEMKLEGETPDAEDTLVLNGIYDAPTPTMELSRSSTPMDRISESRSPVKKQSASQTPKSEDDAEETVGGDITVTVEPGNVPKLSRKASQKIVPRSPPNFSNVEDSTEEANAVFQVIRDCIYGSKHMGYSEHEPLDCDCSEEWSEYLWFAVSMNADGCSRQWQ